MSQADTRKSQTLALLTAGTPESFWRGYQERARALYSGEFAAVAGDSRVNESQKLSKLWQDRHFYMEGLLVSEARQAGMAASAKLIVRNGCTYALAVGGKVSITQKYVAYEGEFPTPARFRADLAAVNGHFQQGSLFLGDEEAELFIPKEVSGIILHSPVGRRFEESQQRLGSMGFYVPDKDYQEWLVKLSFAEILASYEKAEEQEDRVKPIVRDVGRRSRDQE